MSNKEPNFFKLGYNLVDLVRSGQDQPLTRTSRAALRKAARRFVKSLDQIRKGRPGVALSALSNDFAELYLAAERFISKDPDAGAERVRLNQLQEAARIIMEDVQKSRDTEERLNSVLQELDEVQVMNLVIQQFWRISPGWREITLLYLQEEVDGSE